MAAKAIKLPAAVISAAARDGFIPGMQVRWIHTGMQEHGGSFHNMRARLSPSAPRQCSDVAGSRRCNHPVQGSPYCFNPFQIRNVPSLIQAVLEGSRGHPNIVQVRLHLCVDADPVWTLIQCGH